MPEETYEILALLMRYVFAGLIALICARALRWLLHDHRVHARERRQLPRAGQIGVLEFADTGERLPIAPEGLVGAGGICDVVIRKRGLRNRHFTYRLQPRRGVEIVPCRRAQVSVNGQPAQAGRYAVSGAVIEAGDTVLRLRLFKRLRLPQEMQDSPDPILSTWEEDEFLPNGMAVPAAGGPWTGEGPEEAPDDYPEEDPDEAPEGEDPRDRGWGRVLPLFPQDEEDKNRHE